MALTNLQMFYGLINKLCIRFYQILCKVSKKNKTLKINFIIYDCLMFP